MSKLPTYAESGPDGITTYPRMLMAIGLSEKLHIAVGIDGALCGVSSMGRPSNLVEYIRPGARRAVCSACRRAAEAGTIGAQSNPEPSEKE
jgi:hypothetical protein